MGELVIDGEVELPVAPQRHPRLRPAGPAHGRHVLAGHCRQRAQPIAHVIVDGRRSGAAVGVVGVAQRHLRLHASAHLGHGQAPLPARPIGDLLPPVGVGEHRLLQQEIELGRHRAGTERPKPLRQLTTIEHPVDLARDGARQAAAELPVAEVATVEAVTQRSHRTANEDREIGRQEEARFAGRHVAVRPRRQRLLHRTVTLIDGAGQHIGPLLVDQLDVLLAPSHLGLRAGGPDDVLGRRRRHGRRRRRGRSAALRRHDVALGDAVGRGSQPGRLADERGAVAVLVDCDQSARSVDGGQQSARERGQHLLGRTTLIVAAVGQHRREGR